MKKKKYRVSDYRSINACIDQIKKDGYTPVRRIEKPIFEENENGVEPVKQDIIFEAVKTEAK